MWIYDPTETSGQPEAIETVAVAETPAVEPVKAEVAAQAEVAAAPALPDSPFLQHVKQAGVQACSTVFPVLGQLLTTGT